MANENTMTPQQIAEEKRKRQLAILKASNQMIKEAKEIAMKRNDDPIKRSELERQFDTAIEENLGMAESYLNASSEEVENSEYREVSPHEVEKYNKRLEAKGLTDEELHRKSMATITTSKDKKNKDVTVTRRPRRGVKKDLEDIERVENEEELMKRSLVKSDEDIEKAKQKNIEYEQEMAKKEKDITEKVKKEMKDGKETKKVKVSAEDNKERVKVQNETLKEANDRITDQNATVVNKPKKKKEEPIVTYDFDFDDIPSYVQYDVIPLPSKGQCYPIGHPLRCGRIPVAYLTAADENIIASPNVYRDGKLFDIMLERKILDKRINVNDIVTGDRDAIILWLRATSYGTDFPIMATNPQTRKSYNITVDLSQFEYLDFELEGDENGHFVYVTENGNIIKYKFFTEDDDNELKEIIMRQIGDKDMLDFVTKINELEGILKAMDLTQEDKELVEEDITEMKTIIGYEVPEIDDTVFPGTITEQMIKHTVSIDGNTDEEYIRNYIENMRSKDAMRYRNTFIDNKPGVDFKFDVNIPESDGGGSFATFLRLEDTIFINF